MGRRPAVAGQFYPGDAVELINEVNSYLVPDAEAIKALAIVSPHAGYVYSGHVAGAVYSSVVMPERFIILCPNHTGLGSPAAIMTGGDWEIPGASMPVDEDLAEKIMQRSKLFENDVQAHRNEHSLEVQLPFIKALVENPRFVPVCLKTHRPGDLEEIGLAIAEVIKEADDDVLIVASNDMSHFLPDERARSVDKLAIDKVLELDPMGLLETVDRERISMCGVAPVAAALIAANELGASKAELIKYATSGDIFGDRAQVVGYAGIRII